ncbi:MAG: hypothetical protein HUU38_17835 [Anaerolineales bacterium]|nr:hypothetical protein [Anaerolineales bacterium]
MQTKPLGPGLSTIILLQPLRAKGVPPILHEIYRKQPPFEMPFLRLSSDLWETAVETVSINYEVDLRRLIFNLRRQVSQKVEAISIAEFPHKTRENRFY